MTSTQSTAPPLTWREEVEILRGDDDMTYIGPKHNNMHTQQQQTTKIIHGIWHAMAKRNELID